MATRTGYQTVDGKGFDRLNAFSDGVFAIAITILALTLEAPSLGAGGGLFGALAGEWPQLFGFVLSFVIIGRYWIVHHDLFSMMRAYDGKILWLNLLLLMTIVFLPFPTETLSQYDQLPQAYAFYYASIAAVGLAQYALYRYIVRHPRLHYADHAWVRESRHQRVAILIPLAFLIAVPISLASVTLGQWAWTLALLARLQRR